MVWVMLVNSAHKQWKLLYFLCTLVGVVISFVAADYDYMASIIY